MESRRGKCISFWDKMYLFNLSNRPNHEVIPKLLGYFWTRTDQSTPYFFYFVWKEATQESSRGATPKNVPSRVNAVVTTCFDK